MVARATTEHCRAAGDEVTARTRAEMGIADSVSGRRAAREHRLVATINCTAHTNVDGAEPEPRSAYAANELGVENLAPVACESDARFVTISTAYAFDGAKVGFYTQRDTPRPQ